MPTLITGGTSSIGRVLVREMAARGLPMRLLVRKSSNRSGLEFPEVTFVEGDVTDADSVRRAMDGCRAVTHLAAVVGHNLPEEEWWRVNREGSRNVLQAAYELQVSSMVQVSSISVLGYTQPGETADESRPIDTSKYSTLYQKTKHAADEIAQDFFARGLPVKIVYPGFGFGCSQATSHPSLHEQTLLRMAAGKPVAVMGSGKNRLCVAYYRDTAAGILLAHTQGKAGEGYLFVNENLTMTEIWRAVAAVLDQQPPRRRIPLRALELAANASRWLTGKSVFPPEFFEMIAFNWCFSNQKAREQLGWQPVRFEEGLRETWADYQKLGWSLGNRK
jgi:dihydroflavonol-4-reductase